MAEISQIKVGQSSYDIVGSLFYGEVDSTSTSTVFTATISNLKTSLLYDGLTIILKNGVVTSAANFTININGLGAKPVYSNMATGNDITPTAPTRDTTIFNINYTMMFIYSSTLVDDGAWICYRGYDSNSNTIGYQLRTNSGNRPMSDTAYRYRLYFTSADGSKWVPANTSTSTNATTARTLNTRAIDPFGPIVYNSTNDTTSSGERPAVTTLWQQYTLTIGYSYVKTLTAWDSVWLKCQPNTDGSAVMKDIVQALPTSKDGFIYILLGLAYSTTAMELSIDHPVYYHDGTGIRLWTGAQWTSNTGTITEVKTTAGPHTEIDVTSGVASFKVPTKTSHLTNDSGFITDADIPEGASKYTSTPANVATAAVTGTSNAFAPGDHVHAITAATITSVLGYNPVQSVNNQTGVVTLTAADVGAVPSTTNIINDVQYNTTLKAFRKSKNSAMEDIVALSTIQSDLTYNAATNSTGFLTINDIASVMHYKGTKTAVSALPSTGNTTGDVWHITADGSEHAWDGSTWQELGTAVDLSNYVTHGNTGSNTTGISIADHSTTTITGVQSSTTSVTGVQASTTTASKITTTSVSIPNVTSAGSASTWAFENITVPVKNTSATSIPNVTAAGSGSFTQGAFSGGSGSFTQGAFNGGSLTMTMDTTDTKQLNITFTAATHGADVHVHNPATHAADTHVHTPPTLGTAISIIGVQTATTTASHVKSGGNGTAPSLGTALTITAVKSNSDVTVPIKATAATTVPIKNTSTTTVVTGKSHTITDNGHTHTI